MDFLTPLAAIVALVGIVPLVAFRVADGRRRRVNGLLGLAEPSLRFRIAPAIALAAIAALVGLASTQPTVVRRSAKHVRTDAEAFFVLDTSRSMIASSGAGRPTRFARARALAERLRNDLPDIPVGLASITDRTLPHVFPTPDVDTFATALHKVMGIERPPPTDGFSVRVTTLGSLSHIASDNFFSAAATHRLLVVFTDAETKPFTEAGIANLFQTPPAVHAVIVRIWHAGERVYLHDGSVDPLYRADPLSKATADELASAVHGVAVDEDSPGRLTEVARQALGHGPTVTLSQEKRRLALAPYVAGLVFLPLGLLLWRRNV